MFDIRSERSRRESEPQSAMLRARLFNKELWLRRCARELLLGRGQGSVA